LSFKDNGGNKVPKVEVIIEDKETGEKVIIAQYPKSIILPESYCEDMAEVIFRFLKKNTGKLAGRVKKDFKNIVFYEKMVNDKPFKIKRNNNSRKKKKTYKNHHRRIVIHKNNRNY